MYKGRDVILQSWLVLIVSFLYYIYLLLIFGQQDIDTASVDRIGPVVS